MLDGGVSIRWIVTIRPDFRARLNGAQELARTGSGPERAASYFLAKAVDSLRSSPDILSALQKAAPQSDYVIYPYRQGKITVLLYVQIVPESSENDKLLAIIFDAELHHDDPPSRKVWPKMKLKCKHVMLTCDRSNMTNIYILSRSRSSNSVKPLSMLTSRYCLGYFRQSNLKSKVEMEADHAS